MNFLWNKQVLGVVFVLKIHFLIYLIWFSFSLDCAAIIRKVKGSGVIILKTQRTFQWTAG
jgi:hypothetical protein